MIAPGNELIQVVLAIAFVIASGYALGRIHQWHRDGARRELAYRNGYDLASNSMLDMALSRQAPAGAEPAGGPGAEAPAAVTTQRLVGDSRRRIRSVRPEYLPQSTAAS